jgi:hypothetical protein
VTGRAALISQMTSPYGRDDDFDNWYREEHIPARMGIPGFAGAVRGWAVQGEPQHLAIYYLDSLDVLQQESYRLLKSDPSERTASMLATVQAFTRWTCAEIADTGERPQTRYLYVVTFAVPESAQDEFDAWYAEDHIPTLMQASGWSRVRRYAPVGDGTPSDVTRIAVHELTDLQALDSPERASARASAWRARLAEQPWFGSSSYAVYERFEDYTPQTAS